MLALIGIVLVFVAVFGGYILESGNPYVLMQPAELLIIGGAAAGMVMVANPPSVIRRMAHGILSAFRPPAYTRALFLERLRMLYEMFMFARRAGITELEQDAEEPTRSRIFSNYPGFLADRAACGFVCDSLRILVIGATTPYDLDRLMDLDIEVQRRGHHQPVTALTGVADSLPGLGIVAAVLGVVITMEAIGGSPDKIGPKIAAALVGTFLGIFLCYGVVGPLAARLEHLNEGRTQLLQVLRTGMVSFAYGASPILAVEYARRSIPVEQRPSFTEMESNIRRSARIPTVAVPGASDPAAQEGHVVQPASA